MTKFFDLTKPPSKTPELDRLDNLEEYRGKWIELWFHRDGRTRKGIVTHNSQADAQRSIENTFSDHEAFGSMAWKDTRERFEGWHHAIPMPVKS